MPEGLKSEMVIRGNVDIECPSCGYEHKYPLSDFIDKFGLDLSNWEDDSFCNILCYACNITIRLKGPTIIEEEYEENV